MHNVFLLLGSNLGNRFAILKEAIKLLKRDVGLVAARSSIYETAAWGNTDQPDYLNQVILLKTEFAAREVLNRILQIERLMGRERREKWGARTLDIDILFYDDEVINDDDLIVPHPRLHERRFTLEPLNEISPDKVHPILKKTIAQLKSHLHEDLIVKKL